MSEELQKYEDAVNGLMQKLDLERQKSKRLEIQLEQYKDAKALADKIAEKDKVITEQKQLIDTLNNRLAWLQRKVWGQSSEKHASDKMTGQLVLDFGDLDISKEEAEAYDAAQAEIQAYHQKRKLSAKKREETRKVSHRPLPDNLRKEIVHVYPEGYNPEEWELLPEEFNDKKSVLHRKPAEYYVVEYILHKAVRKDDPDRTIQNAKSSATPLAKSYAGSTVIANLMVGKYVDSLPFYRQIEMMKRQGIDIPPATINDWFSETADLMRPIYSRVRQLVMQTDYIQVDETTVPIVNNEKHRTIKGYLWQVRSVLHDLMFFHYDKGSRSQEVALGLLAHFSGTLQTDGYAAYDYYEGKRGVLCLNCWAHTRRYQKDIVIKRASLEWAFGA